MNRTIMDYILANKEAWEEAFDKRCDGWGEDIPDRIKNEMFKWLQNQVNVSWIYFSHCAW